MFFILFDQGSFISRCLKEYLSETTIERSELAKEIDRLKLEIGYGSSDEVSARIISHENDIKELDLKMSSWESKLSKLGGSFNKRESIQFDSSLESLQKFTDTAQFKELVPYIMNIVCNSVELNTNL